MISQDKKVGLFFGSFNPITIGHLIVSRKALDDTELDEIWFVVSPQNPDKQTGELIHVGHRFAMVQIAIEGSSGFKACDVEFGLPQPSYTHISLRVIREMHPDTKFTIVGGTDLYKNIGNWESHEEILEHHDLLIYPRATPEEDFDVSELVDSKTSHLQNVPKLEISATYIREHLKKGKSVQYLIPDSVIRYIELNSLFV